MKQGPNYGYNGSYVDQSDDNYYYRQGFQAAVWTGTATGLSKAPCPMGTYSILSSVLFSILAPQTIGG